MTVLTPASLSVGNYHFFDLTALLVSSDLKVSTVSCRVKVYPMSFEAEKTGLARPN